MTTAEVRVLLVGAGCLFLLAAAAIGHRYGREACPEYADERARQVDATLRDCWGDRDRWHDELEDCRERAGGERP